MQRNNDAIGPQGAKSRRAPQSAKIRHQEQAQFDDALAIIGQIEASAGPTLQEELARSKRVQAAYQSGQEREQFRRRRLGHRSGLLKLNLDRTPPSQTGHGPTSTRSWPSRRTWPLSPGLAGVRLCRGSGPVFPLSLGT